MSVFVHEEGRKEGGSKEVTAAAAQWARAKGWERDGERLYLSSQAEFPFPVRCSTVPASKRRHHHYHPSAASAVSGRKK